MKTKPIRIQRKRTKGWKMPENTVYVGRPTIFGNPFYIGQPALFKKDGYIKTKKEAYESFKEMMDKIRKSYFYLIDEELRGKNLACWCPLDQPCHADVLLKIANEV